MSTKYYRDRLTGDLLLSSEFKITNSSTYEGFYEVESEPNAMIDRFHLCTTDISEKDIRSITKPYFRELSKATGQEEAAQKGFSATNLLLQKNSRNLVFYEHTNQVGSGEHHMIIFCHPSMDNGVPVFYYASLGLTEGSDPGNNDDAVNDEHIGAYGEEEEE